MKTLPLSEVKMNLSSLVQDVHKRDEEIMITKNGSPVAFLISSDEYDGWKETMAILSDPEMMKQIRKNQQQFKAGKYKTHNSVDALFDDLES